jgi:ribose/xylose/arabinose/galactoside ABC-type transport system permease subunit
MKTSLRSIWWEIVNHYMMLFVLVILLVVFSQIAPAFFSGINFRNIVVQNSHVLVLTVGLSFIMMSGAIDLSVGYQVSVISVVTAILLQNGVYPLLAVFTGVLIGIGCGLVNAAFTIGLNIVPFVVTLATQTMFQGISYLISSGKTYTVPVMFRVISRGTFLMIPLDVWIAIISVLIAGFIFTFTYFGRYVKALGGNEEATRLAGINIKLIRMLTYTICGFFAAIAACIVMSKQGITSSTTGVGLEFTGMTAAMLGGISFNRGEGKMWGLVAGVFVLAVIENGMQLAGWNQYIQYIVKGAIMIAAIGFNNYQQMAQVRHEQKKLKEEKR